MKLKDILARELKAWPSQYYQIFQDSGGYLHGSLSDGDLEDCDQEDLPGDPVTIAWDGNNAVVGRAEWQAAVEALKAEQGAELRPTERAVEWDGVGLPPVGAVCEFAGFNPEETLLTDPLVGDKVTVIAHFKSGHIEVAAFTYHAPPEFEYLQVAQGAYGCFRPIRTQEQIAAEERMAAAYAMCAIAPSLSNVDAVALYDAFYRKQVKE